MPEAKVITISFDLQRILSLIPFTPTLYVEICYACVRESNVSKFRELVESGSIVPVLISAYRHYDQEIVDFVASHAHVSAYARDFFRNLVLHGKANGGICPHCAQRRINGIKADLKKLNDSKSELASVSLIARNLAPYVRPDYELLDALSTVVSEGRLKSIASIEKISWKINEIRTSQAFNSPVVFDSNTISKLPVGIASETDFAKATALEVANFTLDGLGLRIPTDIPLRRYIEIVQDYRPSILKVIDNVSHEAKGADGHVSLVDLERQVSKINDEIERVKGLRRTTFLAAGIGFYNNHPQLTVTGLLVAALGMAGSLSGCEATLGIQAVRTIANRVKSKKENIAGARLKKMIERDIHPLISDLIRLYAQTDKTSARVIMLRNVLQRS